MQQLKTIFRKVRATVYSVWSYIDAWLVMALGWSRIGTTIYYLLFNPLFRREQYGVLQGRRAYIREHQQGPSESSALLRRNTHRLEKGLLMQPRRATFALDYIQETVACYAAMVNSTERGACFDELKWARDVLREYFAVTEPTEKTARSRALFSQLPDIEHGDTQDWIPYCRVANDRPDISVDQLRKLAIYRRSVRWYQDRKVPRDLVDQAIEIAGLSPSACNRQPFYFHVIDEPALLEKVVKLPMGTSGYASNIPMMIVLVGQQRNYFHERDRHLIYIDGSLAAMALVFALEVQGLSSCCINWPDIASREKAIAKLLKLDPDERPVMCMSVGFAAEDGMVAYSAKKPLSAMRRFNFE